jgi:hypothetical protein
VATFNDLTIDQGGSGYTLTATSPSLASASTAAFNVTAGPPPAAGCGSPQAGWIFCDDFEVDRLASYFEVVTDGNRFTRVNGVGRDGSYGMRAQFGAGTVSAGSLKLAFGRTPTAYFDPVDAGTKDYREIHWRFFVRLQPGWTGGGGDKLTRATVFANSNWAQAMIAHVWSGSNPNANYVYLDPASGTDEGGTLRTTKYNDFDNLRWLGAVRSTTAMYTTTGQWHCVETRVKLNTAGQSDGVFELRINGVLEASKTGMNWLGSYTAYGINAVFLENYWNDGSPVAQERYFDDLVVSESPIGC